MKTVYILRSVPGAGKSAVAEQIHGIVSETLRSAAICCADDFFMVNGKYNWDPEKIGNAHLQCKAKFLNHLQAGTDVIIVANTNTTSSDVKYYRKLALEYGYIAFVLTVENWHDGKDSHNVPEDTKLLMADSLKNSQRLYKMPTVVVNGKEKPKYKLNTTTNKYEIVKYANAST